MQMFLSTAKENSASCLMLAEGKMQSQDIENKIIHVVMVAYYEDILPIK